MGLLNQMTPNENSPNPAEMKSAIEARLQVEARLKAGASWFYWVAALSIINSVIVLFGGEFAFLFGLGITQFIDGFMQSVDGAAPAIGPMAKLIGFSINLGIAVVVILFGRKAHARKPWAFQVGMALYLVDGVLILLAEDYLGLAFHGWVLFGLYSGLQACNELNLMRPEPPELPSNAQ